MSENISWKCALFPIQTKVTHLQVQLSQPTALTPVKAWLWHAVGADFGLNGKSSTFSAVVLWCNCGSSLIQYEFAGVCNIQSASPCVYSKYQPIPTKSYPDNTYQESLEYIPVGPFLFVYGDYACDPLQRKLHSKFIWRVLVFITNCWIQAWWNVSLRLD